MKEMIFIILLIRNGIMVVYYKCEIFQPLPGLGFCIVLYPGNESPGSMNSLDLLSPGVVK